MLIMTIYELEFILNGADHQGPRKENQRLIWFVPWVSRMERSERPWPSGPRARADPDPLHPDFIAAGRWRRADAGSGSSLAVAAPARTAAAAGAAAAVVGADEVGDPRRDLRAEPRAVEHAVMADAELQVMRLALVGDADA